MSLRGLTPPGLAPRRAAYSSSLFRLSVARMRRYMLSPDGATLTIRTTGTKPQLVATLLRKKPSASTQAPPLAGLYRSNPVNQIMACGTPAGSPATALCVGSNRTRGRTAIFNVVEVQDPVGTTTQQLTSAGSFTTRWSDAAGSVKLQFSQRSSAPTSVLYR